MIAETLATVMRHFCRTSSRRRGKRAAFAGALLGVLVLAGCGMMRGKPGSSSQAGNAIERTAQKGPVSLSVRVSPREPRLSDLVEMDVSVAFEPGVEIKPPAFGQAVGDFLIRDYTERPAESGTKNLRRFHYELEPAHAGKHLIRSVSIEFVDSRASAEHSGEPALVETDPLEVNVTSGLNGEAPSLANLEPMLPPQPVPQAFGVAWLLAAGLVGLVAILFVVFWKRRKPRTIEARRQAPEEIAQAALALLLSENLPARGLVKEFYLRLTGIVRQYVEDTTGIRAPEQTTEEFLRDMHAHSAFPPERSVRLAEFLEAADLVKYAGQEPREGQIELAISRAREFVNLEPASRAVMAVAAN